MIWCMERKWRRERTECKRIVTSHSGGQAFVRTIFIHKTSWINTLNLLLAEPGETGVLVQRKFQSFIPWKKKKRMRMQ